MYRVTNELGSKTRM